MKWAIRYPNGRYFGGFGKGSVNWSPFVTKFDDIVMVKVTITNLNNHYVVNRRPKNETEGAKMVECEMTFGGTWFPK